MANLNPKMRHFLDNLIPVYPEGYTQTIEDIRSRASVVTGAVEHVHKVEDRTIQGPESLIPIRIYSPEGNESFPIVVFFHGGGFVYGDLETHDAVCRGLVNASQHIVVAVDYRLAPEHPFPAAVNDCYAAAKWVYENASEFNGDSTRLSVAGDSAGGNLATVVCLMNKETGGLSIAKQVLMYPVTDSYQPEKYDSYKENGSGYFLTAESMGLFSMLYVQNKDYAFHPYAAPMNATDLSDLPPALIITAEYDPLRDEGELYADKLKKAGVPVTLKREDGLIHGFFNLFSLLDSKDDIKEIYEYIGYFLLEDTRNLLRSDENIILSEK
ncbi:alpha/beta hydrolase [Paenisporosarcina sp. TG20]|uniref:alpha/beta hydrolase n=1 Tax=Paenisporosarcina sp. TG20 TaxID=1211706 RepID=UPI000312A9E1|nr:alpha/beta hydrolase [Paenisporosarcina sp. TG20]